jgi:hypothetical protein
MIIGFHSSAHLSERGTCIAMFDYAYYNQKLNGYKSIIFYQINHFLNNSEVIEKFKKEFQVIAYNSFSENNPGFRIKLLYMDLDLGKPTLLVLQNLWKHVVIGGIVVFDEYAYHVWDESVGVDTFLKTIHNYSIFKTNVLAPTMCIIKLT